MLGRSSYIEFVGRIFVPHKKDIAFYVDETGEPKLKQCPQSNIIKGRTLEELTSLCLNELKKDFVKNPINGIGSDHMIEEEEVEIEEKNWNIEFVVSPTKAKEEIISRFESTSKLLTRFKENNMSHRLLIISKLNVRDQTKRLLSKARIDVIELGYQIVDLSYRVFRRAKRLLFKKLKCYFAHLTRVKIDNNNPSIHSAASVRWLNSINPYQVDLLEHDSIVISSFDPIVTTRASEKLVKKGGKVGRCSSFLG